MPPLPIPHLHPFRQSWGAHTPTRPPNLFPQRNPQFIAQFQPRRTLVWWKKKLQTIREIRAGRRRLTDQFWKNIPPFLVKTQQHKTELNEVRRPMLKAELQRWNGRRYLFLGNYKQRRDAAYAKDENRGVFMKPITLSPIDELFEKTTRKLEGYPCASASRHTRRRFGIGPTFGMDADFKDIESYCEAVEQQLSGREFDLTSPYEVEYAGVIYTQYPGPEETKIFSTKLIQRMETILRGELMIIRAVYEFLIQKYLNRSYMPGLLRLMIRELAARNEWGLMKHFFLLAMNQKDPFLSNRNLASLFNYATSVSIKRNSGQPEIQRIYNAAREVRTGEWRNTERQVRNDLPAVNNSSDRLSISIPASFRSEETNAGIWPSILDSHAVETAKGLRKAAPHGTTIFPYLADAIIRLRAVNDRLPAAMMSVKSLSRWHFVPRYQTVNELLSAILRQENLSSLSLQPKLSPPPPSSTRYLSSNRSYHTGVTLQPGNTFEREKYQLFPEKDGTWLSRMVAWKRESPSIMNEKSQYILQITRLLNHNNIHLSTIRLLAKVATDGLQREIPWKVALRSLHPKTIIRQAQETLVEAGCNANFLRAGSRHFWLARGMLLIMRLEAMKIKPSRESIMIALRASVKDGNVSGARALMNRLTQHGHAGLQQSEVAELVKYFPTNGPGTLSIATGVALSPMYVRTEQIEFVTSLRRFITDPSFLGPYVLALGRLACPAEIWSTWKSIRPEILKDGLITAFVEAFIDARDTASAIEFLKISYSRGYPLNLRRAQIITFRIEKDQKKVWLDMFAEISRQKFAWDKEQIRRVILGFFSRQREPPYKIEKNQVQLIDTVTNDLAEIKESVMQRKDVDNALNELGCILRSPDD